MGGSSCTDTQTWSYPGVPYVRRECSESDQIFAYDPAHDTVSEIGRLPATRFDASGTWDGSRAVLYGGERGGALTSAVDRVATDGATQTVASLPRAERGVASASDGTFAYLVQGVSSTGARDADLLAYRDLPRAPTALTATAPSLGGVALAWAPADTRGLPLVQYHVSRGGVEIGVTTTGSYADASLPDGAALDYGVATETDAGTGGATHVTAFTLPAAPLAATATPGPGAGEITASWTPPPQPSGSPIMGYRVYAGPQGGTLAFLAQVSGAARSATESGLGAGVARSYVVRAVTAQGEGRPTTALDATSPTLPGAPLALAATAGPLQGQVTLSWSPPASDGGLPLRYHVHLVDAAGEHLVGNATATTFTDSGQPDSTVLTYDVNAENAVGEGPASAPASIETPPGPIVPPGLPSVPGRPTATSGPGAGQVSVSWTPSLIANDSAPLQYIVHRIAGGDERRVALTTLTAIVDAGLPPGVLFTYRVSALNTLGESALTASASAATPTRPNPPTSVTATQALGSDNVVLHWARSGSYLPVTGYQIWREGALDDTFQLLATVGNTTAYIDAHAPLGPYKYRVGAISTAGEGTLSTPTSITSVASPLVAAAPPQPPGSGSSPHYAFDATSEGFARETDRPHGDVSWDAADRRIHVDGSNADAADELFTRALPDGTWTDATGGFAVSARWEPTADGRWNDARPLLLADAGLGSITGTTGRAMYVSAAGNDQRPTFTLALRDMSGANALRLDFAALAGTEYRFAFGYESSSRIAWVAVRDDSGHDLSSAWKRLDDPPGSVFRFGKIGVGTVGVGSSGGATMVGWVDDIVVARHA
jgi:hypothetical protein